MDRRRCASGVTAAILSHQLQERVLQATPGHRRVDVDAGRAPAPGRPPRAGVPFSSASTASPSTRTPRTPVEIAEHGRGPVRGVDAERGGAAARDDLLDGARAPPPCRGASPRRACRSARPRPAGGWRRAPCGRRRRRRAAPRASRGSAAGRARWSARRARAGRAGRAWPGRSRAAAACPGCRCRPGGRSTRRARRSPAPPSTCDSSVGRPVAAQYSARFSAPDRCGRKPGPSTNAPIRDSTGAPGPHLLAEGRDRARGRPDEAHEHAQHGGLARAVRPEQAEHLPRSTVNDTPSTALNPPLYVLAQVA